MGKASLIKLIALSSLGVMLHSNGREWLKERSMGEEALDYNLVNCTDETSELVISVEMAISFPFSSFALPKLYTERSEATTSQRVDLAR
jgi:hypothetical protein